MVGRRGGEWGARVRDGRCRRRRLPGKVGLVLSAAQVDRVLAARGTGVRARQGALVKAAYSGPGGDCSGKMGGRCLVAPTDGCPGSAAGACGDVGLAWQGEPGAVCLDRLLERPAEPRSRSGPLGGWRAAAREFGRGYPAVGRAGMRPGYPVVARGCGRGYTRVGRGGSAGLRGGRAEAWPGLYDGRAGMWAGLPGGG